MYAYSVLLTQTKQLQYVESRKNAAKLFYLFVVMPYCLQLHTISIIIKQKNRTRTKHLEFLFWVFLWGNITILTGQCFSADIPQVFIVIGSRCKHLPINSYNNRSNEQNIHIYTLGKIFYSSQHPMFPFSSSNLSEH